MLIVNVIHTLHFLIFSFMSEDVVYTISPDMIILHNLYLGETHLDPYIEADVCIRASNKI